MKERQIIFNSEMVRAILEGRKTMTRRPLKPQPYDDCDKLIGPEMYETAIEDKFGMIDVGPEIFGVYDEHGEYGIECPFGQPGDRLWVRETYRVAGASGYMSENGPNKYEATIEYKSTYDKPINGSRMGRTVELPEMNYGGNLRIDGGVAWRPSIHMPRWASRITLEITNVRVERVQEISEADAIAEGIYIRYKDLHTTHRAAFVGVWDTIYGKGSDAWVNDPWVWVVEFKRKEPR